MRIRRLGRNLEGRPGSRAVAITRAARKTIDLICRSLFQVTVRLDTAPVGDNPSIICMLFFRDTFLQKAVAPQTSSRA